MVVELRFLDYVGRNECVLVEISNGIGLFLE